MSQQNNEQTELLREILKWTKFSAMKEVAPILEERLDSDIKRLVYQKSDGTKGAREIASEVKKIQKTQIMVYWREWLKAPAIGETIPVKGGGNRFRKIFDLSEFGLGVEPEPELKEELAVVSAATKGDEQQSVSKQ